MRGLGSPREDMVKETKAFRLFKTASVITLITLGSRALGFVRELIIAYFFGTSTQVDMYLMAVNIPTVLLGFITCVGTAYTPVYTEISVREGRRKSLGFTSMLLLVMAAFCALVIVICSCSSTFLVRFAAPGFSGEMTQTTSLYLKIALWNLLIETLMNIFICYLNCNEKYVLSSLCMLFHTSVQIVFTVLAHFVGPIFLTIGFVMANLCYFLAIVIASVKSDYRFDSLYVNRRYVGSLLRLVIPIAASSLITQVNGYIDNFYASGLETGSISALYYANRVCVFLVMMLNTGLITMFYPMMSRMVAEENFAEAKSTLLSSVSYVVLVFLPITVLLFLFSGFITTTLFARGQFDAGSVSLTSTAMRMYALGISAVALREVLFNYYYSVKDSAFTLLVSAVCIAVNILLNSILVRRMGIGGLALATSLSTFAAIPLLCCRLGRKLRFTAGDFRLAGLVLKCLGANALPTACLCMLRHLWLGQGFVISCLAALGYLLLYYALLKLLKVGEIALVEEVISKIVGKIRRKSEAV